MNIPSIFISYSSKDSSIALKLKEDLKKNKMNPWIYEIELKHNRQFLADIDNALSDSNIVLGIITENYEDSVGMKEFYAQFSSKLKGEESGFIPLFFTKRENIKSKLLKSIWGIDFIDDYETNLVKLIEKLGEEEDSGVLLSKIESPTLNNPFRRARAEVFGNDYNTIARAFAIPEQEKYDILLEATPTFIIGGRGSGKTMLLKSLTTEVQLHIKKAKNLEQLKNKGVNYFGLYFRIEKGSLLIFDSNIVIETGFRKSGQEFNYDKFKTSLKKMNNLEGYDLKTIGEDPILSMGINSAWVITLNELNFKILMKLLKKLKSLSNNAQQIIRIDENTERIISGKISKKLNIHNEIKNFNELIEFVDTELSLISSYLQELSLPYGDPKPTWHKTNIKFIDNIIEILKENIGDLRDLNFFLIFDEFENLRPYQQTIIIEWVKTASNFHPKIASKFEGIYTNLTLQGQPLQFGQDCPFPIEMDYDMLNIEKRKNFRKFLVQICENLMEIEGWKNKNIIDLLPNLEETEISQDLIDKKIKEIRENANLEYITKNLEKYRNYLQKAAIFRLLKQKDTVKKFGKSKIYAGFNTFSLLSSGIIRIFMNLASMSVYKAMKEGIRVDLGEPIPVKYQSLAAFSVSKGWLEKIPENYDFKEYGFKIYQLIVDIGYILRQKLLHHATEPESLCFTIQDPINLNKKVNQKIYNMLCYAVRESILYCREQSSTIIAKNIGEMKPKEYILNRIYSPILRISYRTRWSRNHLSVKELKNLLNEKNRQKTLNQIVSRIKKEDINIITLDEWDNNNGNK